MRLLSKRMLLVLVRAATANALLAALIAGCAAPTEHPALNDAGAAVERARGSPRVRALAAAELDRAEVALEHARAAAWAGVPSDQVEHLAYVVSQRAALAEARAAERIARSEIGKLQRALGQVLAHGRLEQDGQAPGEPLEELQRGRALGQMRREQDGQVWASPAQRDQQADTAIEEAPHERVAGQREQETRAPPKQDPRERALVQRDPQTGAAVQEDQQERALGEVLALRRPEQDRQVWASPTHWDQQAESLEADQQGPASMRQNPQTPALLRGDRQERARGQMRLEQDRQVGASAGQRDQQPGAPLEADQQGPASVQQDLHTRALLEEDQRKGALVQQDQQARMPLEQDQYERASVQENQQTRAPLKQGQLEHALVEQDQEARAPLEEHQLERASREPDRRERASLQEDQQTRSAAPDDGAATLGMMPQDITLSLAQLRFEGAEPTSDTIEELAVVAERLLGEPGRSILIEADFDLPDPEARTEMERRVEVVRAILVQRGIAAARLVVRAIGDGPVEPPASSSFVEPPD